MEDTQVKNMISEYDAERQYARNKVEEAEERQDERGVKVWEAIETAFTDLVYKLNSL